MDYRVRMIQNSSAVLAHHLRLPSNKMGNLFEVSPYTCLLALSIAESRLMLKSARSVSESTNRRIVLYSYLRI
jgi:hypothetical protein